MSGSNALQITDPNASDNPLYAGTPSEGEALGSTVSTGVDRLSQWLAEQRAKSSQMGLWNDRTNMPTTAGLVSAAQQYGSALMMGTTAPGEGASATPQVPKEFTAKADTQAAAEGKRFIDATGIHFLDGDKPVYAWNGADPTPVLGSRASELSDYPSISLGNHHVWYKPGELSRAQQVLSLSELVSKTDPKSPYLPSYDSALGKALGYPAGNVDRYIQWKYGSNQ